MPRLITFGGLSVENGTVINGLANPRSRLAILAVIATAGDRGIRREKLAALFWPESDEERARNALRQALFILKRDLRAGEITLGVADLRLNPDAVTADVSDFDSAIKADRVEDAAMLYRGPFLDGVHLRESPEFERWADEQRRRLSAEYARALENAAASAITRGDRSAAVRWRERLAVHDPLSGRVARAYMEALVAAGERERAIMHAGAHARLVRQELEVEPEPDVLTLATRLREAPIDRGEPPSELRSPAADPVAPSVGQRIADPESARGSRLEWKRAMWVGVIAAVAGGVMLATTLRSDGPPIQPGLVAIGFIENGTGDSSINVIVDQATTEIAQLLSESQHATVTDLRASVADESPGSASRVRAASLLARRSAAEHLVQGHATRQGDSIVVVAQVLNARTGHIVHQLEKITSSRTRLHDVLEPLREGIGGAIMALNDSIFRSSWGGPRPPRYSAYVEFMRGVDAMVQRYEPNAATPYFLKAMTLDSAFVQPKLLYLGSAEGSDERQRIDSVRKALEAQHPRMTAYDKAATDRLLSLMDRRYQDAFTAARQMVSLAPRSPDALLFLAQTAMLTRRYRRVVEALHTLRASPGWVKDLNSRRMMDYQAHRLLGDYEIGIAEFYRDAADAVNDPGMCQYGFPLLAAGGYEQAVDSLLTSCTGVRSSIVLQAAQLQIAGRNYRMAGHMEAAERALRRALTLRVELAKQDTGRWFGIVQAHADLGEWPQVYDSLKGKSALGPVQRVLLGTAAAYTGDTTTALQTLRSLEPLQHANAHADRAFILIGLRRHDEAIAELTAAQEAGVVPNQNQWYIRPELHAIRGDPRFEALIRPVRP